jgi:hypothetical protein
MEETSKDIKELSDLLKQSTKSIGISCAINETGVRQFVRSNDLQAKVQLGAYILPMILGE